MTAKEYLSQCYELECDIRRKSDDLEKYRAIAEKISSTGSGTASGGSGSDRVGRSAARLVDLEKEIKSMKRQYARLYKVIGRRIAAVNGEAEREILRQRYLCFRSWRMIGRAMKMNHVLVQYYHKKGLENFSEFFLKKS